VKIIKAHLVEIIAGLLVLLGIGTLFWPLPAMSAALSERMSNRFHGGVDDARKLASTTVEIPPNYSRPDTAIVQKDIDSRSEVLKTVRAAADGIDREYALANQRGRVDPNGRPLLDGKPYIELLPQPVDFSSRPHEFKKAYAAYHLKILHDLTNSNDPDAFDAPTDKDVQSALDLEKQRRISNAVNLPLGGVVNPAEGNVEKARQLELTRGVATARAASLRMYVTDGALPNWHTADESAAPTAKEIYEAFVTSWIVSDVARAITVVNDDSANVSESPIKHLLLIAIGSNAATASVPGANSGGMGSPVSASAFVGSLFLSPNSPPPGPGGAGPGPAAPAGSDQARFIGTRFDNRFDVTHVRIVADMTPTAINKLINALYAGSNSYAVRNIQSVVAVDPMESAALGYLYGKTPVVRVDLVVEARFFRSWTVPIMPQDYKSLLQINDNTRGPGGGRFGPGGGGGGPGGGGSRGGRG